MIKFFRHIRQRLLSQNKFTRYLMYALGEIVLVVIGILLALQINNWNQLRKDKELEKNYLISISIDLDQMKVNLNRAFITRFNKKIESLLLAKSYYESPKAISDTLNFLSTVSYGAVGSGGFIITGNSTYEELLSTGGIRLIRNDSLRKNLSVLYSYVDLKSNLLEYYKTDFLTFINRLKPFDPKNPNLISAFDQIEMMESLKSKEFGRNVDHELTYAYKIIEETTEILSYVEMVKEQVDNELLTQFNFKASDD